MKPTKSPLTPAGLTIVALRREIADLRSQLCDLMTFFPPKHPALRAAKRALKK